MSKKMLVAAGTLAVAGLMAAGPASARNFSDWMNPSKWFGGDHDYDRDYYRHWGYPGWGYGGYPGWGYGGYPGWGYGGYPGWGYGGYPGWGYSQQSNNSNKTPAPPPTPQ